MYLFEFAFLLFQLTPKSGVAGSYGSLSSVTAEGNTSSTMLNSSGEIKHLCLSNDLKWKAFSLPGSCGVFTGSLIS